MLTLVPRTGLPLQRLHHSASLGGFETLRAPEITETLTGPNTSLSTCHHMECAGWHMLERSPQTHKARRQVLLSHWPWSREMDSLSTALSTDSPAENLSISRSTCKRLTLLLWKWMVGVRQWCGRESWLQREARELRVYFPDSEKLGAGDSGWLIMTSNMSSSNLRSMPSSNLIFLFLLL